MQIHGEMTEEEALEKALQASMAENSGPKENVVKEPKVTVKPLSKMKDESKKQIKNSRKSIGKENQPQSKNNEIMPTKQQPSPGQNQSAKEVFKAATPKAPVMPVFQVRNLLISILNKYLFANVDYTCCFHCNAWIRNPLFSSKQI